MRMLPNIFGVFTKRPVEREDVKVYHEGEVVYLQIGNVVKGFDHRAAIKVAAWMRHHGQMAKRNAGDMSKILTVIGTLEDAEESYRLNRKEIV